MSEKREMVVTFEQGVRVCADYQGHHIPTDQPVDEGGQGSAPEPYVLFLASLGTCAGFYVLRFCQARDIPTQGIRLVQTMERDPESNNLIKVGLEIQVPADFPAKYHKALVKSAEKCAVKRTLENPPQIDTCISVVS